MNLNPLYLLLSFLIVFGFACYVACLYYRIKRRDGNRKMRRR